MPPISNFQIIVSFILVGVTRGLTVAIAAAIFMLPFVQIEIYSFIVVLFFAVISSAILSLMIVDYWSLLIVKYQVSRVSLGLFLYN